MLVSFDTARVWLAEGPFELMAMQRLRIAPRPFYVTESSRRALATRFHCTLGCWVESRLPKRRLCHYTSPEGQTAFTKQHTVSVARQSAYKAQQSADFVER